jgi:glyoxylase-like metal-dependent hydrolase (beta-lactamase superfamily II)
MERLAPGIVAIGGESRGWVRAFLVEYKNELTLVDTLATGHHYLILAAIRSLGRSISDLKQIWLTHAHGSHVGGAAVLQALSGATVWSHEWEADIVSRHRKSERTPLLPRRPLRAYVPFQLGLALGIDPFEPCKVDEFLKDEHEASGLTALHTPGHTRGHLAFWVESQRVLLSGDAVVTWPGFAAGWDSFTLDRDQQRASLRRMAALAPRAVGVGHGRPIKEDAANRVDSLL